MLGGLLPSPGAVPRTPSKRAFLLCALGGLLVLLGLSQWIAAEMRDAASRRLLIRDALEHRINSADLISDLHRAEAAQRGYIITGDPAFLTEFDTARRDAAAEFADAYDDPGNVGPQAVLQARLGTLIKDRFAELGIVIALRQKSGLPAAAARFSEQRGAAAMNAIYARIDRLDRIEQASMRIRVEAMRSHYIWLGRMLGGVTLLVGVLLLAGTWLLWRSRAQRFALERNAHDTSTRLLAMFAGNADATLLLDGDGRIEAANAAAKRLLGYGTSDLIGRDIISFFDLDDRREFRVRIGLVDGRIAHPYWPDRAARHSDGSRVPIDIALGVIELPDGPRVLMMMRDIAQRKSIERLKDEFLATISHELRTPLTSVVGALGLLRKGAAGPMPEAADRLVEIAENNSRRLIRLVNDLLDIEKIGTGRMRFDRAPIDMVHVAEIAIDAAIGIASERTVGIELVAATRPLIVQGDRDRLLQVLANLLSNAIRVSPEGRTALVTVAQESGQVVVTVDDEGPGVPSEFNGRIFERFAQASGTVVGGSGLGLAISREIVVAHDGRIWFGRSAAGGARFAFALPSSRLDEPLRGSRPCILLAMADPAEALFLQHMLEAENCGVETVASTAEMLTASASGRYDALVIDAHLPDSGGVATVRMLRHRAETLTLPAILVSADAIVDPGRAQGPALEPVDWVAAPVERDRLIAAVRRAIALSTGLRATLLHVDDDIDMLEIAATMLAEQGRVVHATSVASARAVIATQAPDIVILDLHLPDGSGIELLPDMVRADGGQIPVVIYPAFDVPPEIEGQVDAVLVKSRRSLDSLAAVIRRILAARSLDIPPAP